MTQIFQIRSMLSLTVCKISFFTTRLFPKKIDLHLSLKLENVEDERTLKTLDKEWGKRRAIKANTTCCQQGIQITFPFQIHLYNQRGHRLLTKPGGRNPPAGLVHKMVTLAQLAVGQVQGQPPTVMVHPYRLEPFNSCEQVFL